MSFLSKDAIMFRLTSGNVELTDGEVKSILNMLVEKTNEIERSIESLRRSESTEGSSGKDSSSGVRRGRKPKQNSGETSKDSGHA